MQKIHPNHDGPMEFLVSYLLPGCNLIGVSKSKSDGMALTGLVEIARVLNCASVCQWLFLVPVKGGRWHIIPQLAVYTIYILPSGGLHATYHLFGEPETTIEFGCP